MSTLTLYVGAARKAGGRGRACAARPVAVAEKPARSKRDEAAAICAWARESADQVSGRGGILNRSSRRTRPRT